MAKKKRKVVKQKIGTIKVYDWRERKRAENYFYRWKSRGYRVFDVAQGQDAYALMSAKRKPTKADLEEYGVDSSRHKSMIEIKKQSDFD